MSLQTCPNLPKGKAALFLAKLCLTHDLITFKLHYMYQLTTSLLAVLTFHCDYLWIWPSSAAVSNVYWAPIHNFQTCQTSSCHDHDYLLMMTQMMINRPIQGYCQYVNNNDMSTSCITTFSNSTYHDPGWISGWSPLCQTSWWLQEAYKTSPCACYVFILP